MRSATLIAALFGAVAFAGPVARGTTPSAEDCEETPKSPSAPSTYNSPSPYGGPTSGGLTSGTPMAPPTYNAPSPYGGPTSGGPTSGTPMAPSTPKSPTAPSTYNSPSPYGSPASGGPTSGTPMAPSAPKIPTAPSTYNAPSPYGSSSGPISYGSSGSNSSTPFTNNTICGAASYTNYTVKSGDTLTTIAKNFGSGICDIAATNNITNPNLVNLGQALRIPVNCTTPDNSTCIPPPAPNATETCVTGLPSAYTVVSGDTLTAIAKDFNITLDSIIKANPNITNPDAIAVGQVISIPVCPSSQCAVVGTYTIASGDLFVDLASKYGTTIGQIKALNPTVDPTKTQPGDQIVLPQHCANVTTAVA